MNENTQVIMTENQILLQEAKAAFTMVKGSTIVAMQKLYKIKEGNVWQDVADTWGAYCEGELGISQSFASGLMTVHRVFLTEGNIQPLQLQGIDVDKLYLAKDLEGTPEQKLTMAKTLSRVELKQTRGDSPDHEHVPKTITICDSCGVKL